MSFFCQLTFRTGPMFPNLPLLFINRTLKDETWARLRLQAHAGQTACLKLGAITIRVSVGTEGLLQRAAADTVDDVTVSLPASVLPLIIESPHEITRHAHIEGSASLADTLAILLQYLRPDVAGWLAPFMGNVLATRSVQVADKLAHNGLQAARLGEDLIYRLLHERLAATPDTQELHSFGDEVTHLSQDLERLEARLRR